ncbi:MAG: hypothetical protein ACK5NK_09655 [Niabella sp.]
MKTITKISLLIIGFIAMSAATVNEILEQLSIKESNAQYFIFNNFVGSFNSGTVDVSGTSGDHNSNYNQLKSFQIPKVQLSTIASGGKAAAALELCQYVKTYTSSKAFATEYAKKRENAKPTSEPYRMDAATIEGMKKSVKQMETDLAKMKAQKLPASATQQMEAAIAQQKNQIALQSDPTPNLSAWKKMYPENPATMIENRLKEYLTLVKTVDFNATTSGSGKKKIFTNANYEAKSLKWKAIYRAGSEVNKAVSQFVNEWLKEGVLTGVASMPKSSDKSPGMMPNKKSESSSDDISVSDETEKPKSIKNIKSKLKNKLGSVINSNL